jgi:hypothetical protein
MDQPLKKLLGAGTNALAIYLVIHPQSLSFAHLFFCRIGFRFASIFNVARKRPATTGSSSGSYTGLCRGE